VLAASRKSARARARVYRGSYLLPGTWLECLVSRACGLKKKARARGRVFVGAATCLVLNLVDVMEPWPIIMASDVRLLMSCTFLGAPR